MSINGSLGIFTINATVYIFVYIVTYDWHHGHQISLNLMLSARIIKFLFYEFEHLPSYIYIYEISLWIKL